MKMSDVRINIDFTNGILNIEGDSEFVDKQIIRFENEIKQQLSKRFHIASETLIAQVNKNEALEVNGMLEQKIEHTSYEDIFEIHDSKLHIIKDIPGNSLKEKVSNSAVGLKNRFIASIIGFDERKLVFISYLLSTLLYALK